MNNIELVAALEPLVKEAGEILLSYFQKTVHKTFKENGSFATQADLASERFLIQNLETLIQGVSFFAEESGIRAGNEYCWVIDPLDGTTNFAQGLPYFCISVALTHHGQPILGVVYQPILKEFFYAIKGHGAFLNGVKLQISDTAVFNESVVIFELPYRKEENFCDKMGQMQKVVYTSRTFGAAALDQAYCAAGRADAAIFGQLGWWDVAAGMLLITEAGGVVTDFEGGTITSGYRSFVAGNRFIHGKIREIVTL